MKYILALAGLASGAAAFFFYSVAESAIHEGVAMMAACACLIGLGSATITHAIDAHREKMEDLAEAAAQARTSDEV